MVDATDRLYERILLLRCQAGDELAFAELVGRYSPRLRYFLRRLLDDDHAAEDVLQETLCDIFYGLPRLVETGAFVAWMYRIARDRAYRELRRRRKWLQPVADLESAGGVEQNGVFTPDDAEQIHAALGSLAPEHREVLVLRFLEGMSYEDIARTIGCVMGTVRSRIHYAKRALRHAMERMNES